MITRNRSKLTPLGVVTNGLTDPELEASSTGVEGTGSDPITDQNFVKATVDIHVATLPSHQPDKSSSERKGRRGVTPVKQGGKADIWSDLEIEELKRLVGNNTGPKGISWVKVELAWKDLGLPLRSKASLSSKWRAVKASTLPGTVENAQTDAVTEENAGNGLSCNATSNESSNEHTARDSSIIDVEPVVARKNKKQPVQQATVDEMKETTTETIKMVFKKKLQQARKIGCLPNKRKPPKKVSGKQVQPILSEVNKLVDAQMDSWNGSLSWDRLSILVYAGAMTVSTISNQGVTEKQQRSRLWFKSSYEEVENLRKVIGKATAELNRQKEIVKRNAEVAPTQQQTNNIKMLRKKYKVRDFAEITSLVERLKCRMRLLQSRIALREADERRIRVRQMPTKVLLRSIEPKSKGKEKEKEKEVPNVNSIRRFWKEIVGVKKSFNVNKQLVAWERSLTNVKGDDNLREKLSPELWQKVVSKSKPWKAHGPDGIQGYWWKVFKRANLGLYQLVFDHLTNGKNLPQGWIAEGRVILLYKSGPRSDPANFRPIACLNTCYKLLTGFVATYLDQYVRERNILPSEQVALRGGIWGSTHALILDQTMTADAQDQKQRPISVAWIDYAKAFDSVPHSYMKWLLSAVHIPIPLKRFLQSLMKMWKVRYEVRSPRGQTERSSYLRIRSGVLQGDSFSPLLFCLAMAPISHAINNTRCCYVTGSGKLKKLQISLSHLFYMDDLKLFANSAENLSKQIKAVTSISDAISMKLNVKKCAQVHFIPMRLRNEQVQSSEDPETSEGVRFPMLDGESAYKYLGIEQTLGLKEADAWDRVEAKCLQIVQKLWASDLTFRQKVNSHNSTVLPVINYIVGCIIKGSGKYQSGLKSGEDLDTKIRKILVKEKARYKCACVARLYLATDRGGCGLKSVRDTIEQSTIYTWAYLCTKAELKGSLNLFANMANREKRCVVSDAASVLKSYNINAEFDIQHSRVILNGTQFDDAKSLARHVVSLMRTDNDNRRYETWRGKKCAGRVLRHSSSNIDVQTSFTWLREGKLSSVAVRNVLAAQEGSLMTRVHPSSPDTGSKSCRACGKTMETVEHIVSSCSKWLPNLYIDRHDSVARNIHYKLCQMYGLTPPHYSQKVDPVLGNERVKLYWNQPVQTKTVIRHNKPDIIAFDKIGKTAKVIEVAVSWFTGIVKQTEIKRNRYCVNGNWEEELELPYPRGDNLQRELQSQGWKVTFYPIVIGACGEVLSNLPEQLQNILNTNHQNVEKCIERLQRSAVLGTSRVIKNHLADV